MRGQSRTDPKIWGGIARFDNYHLTLTVQGLLFFFFLVGLVARFRGCHNYIYWARYRDKLSFFLSLGLYVHLILGVNYNLVIVKLNMHRVHFMVIAFHCHCISFDFYRRIRCYYSPTINKIKNWFAVIILPPFLDAVETAYW